jgi:hypothetical protein
LSQNRDKLGKAIAAEITMSRMVRSPTTELTEQGPPPGGLLP